ncbi:hypothetical protein [Rhodalgimonas zhirmunskyi]|uniref:Uncharacterized protein n=1 Tax=Rhodalgimonas zhirmunskyi TaxID=2964767 RepID=A0AAJ1X5V5_9RHOB|nr:hypothetical protein [Rhodoalgimonas zhirmunskyi]MDQ2092782.1 hypothetical protein [Rhodoalgimonas zhirmunskyi]
MGRLMNHSDTRRNAQPVSVSVVGCGDSGPIAPQCTPAPANLAPVQICYKDVAPEMLQKVQPCEVICWLCCADYDVYDIAERLSAARYSGRVTICAPDLLRPEHVLWELRRDFPTLDLKLMTEAPLTDTTATYLDGIAAPTASEPTGSEGRSDDPDQPI